MARRYHGKTDQRPPRQVEGTRFGPKERGTPRTPTFQLPVREQLLQRAAQTPPQTTEGKPTPNQILRQMGRER